MIRTTHRGIYFKTRCT